MQSIQFKRSNKAGAIPAPTAIGEGEIAINLQDHVIHTKDAQGQIVQISVSPEKHQELTETVAANKQEAASALKSTKNELNTKIDTIKTATDSQIAANHSEINAKVDQIKKETDATIASNKALAQSRLDSAVSSLTETITTNKADCDSALDALTDTVERNKVAIEGTVAANKTHAQNQLDAAIAGVNETIAANKAAAKKDVTDLTEVVNRNKVTTDTVIQNNKEHAQSQLDAAVAGVNETIAANKAEAKKDVADLTEVVNRNKTTTDALIEANKKLAQDKLDEAIAGINADIAGNVESLDRRFVNSNGDSMTGNYRISGGSLVVDSPLLSRTVNSFDDTGFVDKANFNLFGAFRTNGVNGMDSLTLNIPHSGGQGHGRGFTMEYGSNNTRGRAYTYGYAADGTLNYKHRMWHDGDKPTPTEMGVATRFWGTSDMPLGTLIETDIDASHEQGASFTVDIISKVYAENAAPLSILAEGYMWDNTFITSNAKIDGQFNGEIFFLKMPNGKLGIWFPSQGYWKNYGVIVYQTNAPAGYATNHVTAITNSAKPASDKILNVPKHYVYGTFRKPSADDIVANSTINGSLTLNGTQYIDCRKQRNHLAFKWSDSGTAWIYVDPNQNLLQMSSPINFEGSATWKPADGSNSPVKIRNWGNAAAGRATVMEAGDEHGWYWYAQRPANNAGSAPEFNINGRMIASQSINTSSRAFRTVGRFGSFWHNDSMDRLYLMFTNENDAYSETWSDKRPVIFNMRTGSALFSHGVNSSAGFNLPANVSITWNSSGEWASGIGWGMQEEGATGDMILHRYNNGQWIAAPFRFQNDHTFVCAGNGNFNDVYIRSDSRLKINREKVENALDKIDALTAYTYDKLDTIEAHEKDEDERAKHIVAREVGIIAQDLRKVLPEAVTVLPDDTHIISNSGVNALLVKGVQELHAENQELKERLAKIEALFQQIPVNPTNK